MQLLKRIFRNKGFLVLLITMITLNTSLIYGTNTTFKDVGEGEWYIDDLNALTAQNIISGFPDGTFRGDSLLQMDQLVKMLVVSLDYDITISGEYWAQNYINQANILNWLDGISQTDTSDVINRYDACRMIINAAGTTEIYPDNISDYSIYINDYNIIPEEYKEDVLKVYYLGIITGYENGNFEGDNNLTRAESVAIINRFIDPSIRRVPLDPSSTELLISFQDNSQIFNESKLKLINNVLNYYDSNTDRWTPIYNTGLEKKIGRISEDIYVEMAEYISNSNMDSSVTLSTAYSHSTFYMYLNNNGFQCISYEANDSSNSIRISLPTLYQEPLGELDSSSDALLKIITNYLTPDSNQIYDYINSEFTLNATPNPITSTTTIDGYTITTDSSLNNFIVTIAIQ
jgi:hypothetical protein